MAYYKRTTKKLFSDSNIQITTDGHRHLGAVIGTEANKENFVRENFGMDKTAGKFIRDSQDTTTHRILCFCPWTATSLHLHNAHYS